MHFLNVKSSAQQWFVVKRKSNFFLFLQKWTRILKVLVYLNDSPTHKKCNSSLIFESTTPFFFLSLLYTHIYHLINKQIFYIFFCFIITDLLYKTKTSNVKYFSYWKSANHFLRSHYNVGGGKIFDEETIGHLSQHKFW